jgi:hypothetical protein
MLTAEWTRYDGADLHLTQIHRSMFRRHVEGVAPDFVSCRTADREQLDQLRPTRGFHVFRDPRDIVVSGYFSHRYSHDLGGNPHIETHRRELERASILEQGLLLEMEFASCELRELADWDYTDSQILELKLEELAGAPYDTFLRIFGHLDLLVADEPMVARDQAKVWLYRLVNRLSYDSDRLARLQRTMPVTGEALLGTVYAHRFEAQAGGRERGTEDPTSHYRSGAPQGWRRYFTGANAEAFDREFGELLIELEYEQDRNWVERHKQDLGERLAAGG